MGVSHWILLVLGNFVICGQLGVSVWTTYNFKAVFALPFMLVHLLAGGTAFFLCCLCGSWGVDFTLFERVILLLDYCLGVVCMVCLCFVLG